MGLDGPVTGGHLRYFEAMRPVDDLSGRRLVERLEELVSGQGADSTVRVVVSAENLFNDDRFPGVFVEASDRFEVHVIAYIRRQDEYLTRAWNQWHFKAHPDFRAWLELVKGRVANWERRLAAWERTLPNASISVRIFDRDRLVGGDAALDFLDLLGFTANLVTVRSAPVNPGLNELAMLVARRNRHLYAGPHDHRFTTFLATYGGEMATAAQPLGLGIGRAERRAIVEAYAPSNEVVRRRYFPELPEGGLFSTEFAEEAAPVARDELVDRELDLLWSIVYRIAARAEGGGDRL
jgi:hypothetical protein